MTEGQNLERFDATLIGTSYLSYILGLRLLGQGEKIMILKDQRIAYGEEFSQYLFEVDKSFLLTWGELFNIGELSNLTKYLKPMSYYVNFENKVIRLGNDPSYNLRELQRKLPDIFSPSINWEDFDYFHFADFITQLANKSLQFKSFANFENEIFEEHLPEKLEILVDDSFEKISFKNTDNKQDIFTKNHLKYIFNSLFFNKMQSDMSKTEWTYIVICLLGRRYRVETGQLLEKLEKLFADRGGATSNHQIENWKVRSGKAEKMLMKDSDMSLEPGNIYFMGRPTNELPFELDTDKQIFCSYQISLTLKDDSKELYEELQSPHYVYFESSRGKDVPFFYSYPKNKKTIVITFPFPEIKGSKAKFYLPDILDLVERWLLRIGFSLKLSDFQENIDLCNDFTDWGVAKKKPLLNYFKNESKGKYDFQYVNSIHFKKKIKNIGYWGPMNGHNLGKSSLFMDLKSSIYSSQ